MNYNLADLALNGNSMAFYTEVVGANTLEYYCFPRQPDALVWSKTWKVMLLTTVTAWGALAAWKCVQRAGWSPEYENHATDLATVKALSYS